MKEIKDYTKHTHVLDFEQFIAYDQEGEEIKIADLVNSIVGYGEENIIREIIYHMEIELVCKTLKYLTLEV